MFQLTLILSLCLYDIVLSDARFYLVYISRKSRLLNFSIWSLHSMVARSFAKNGRKCDQKKMRERDIQCTKWNTVFSIIPFRCGIEGSRKFIYIMLTVYYDLHFRWLILTVIVSNFKQTERVRTGEEHRLATMRVLHVSMIYICNGVFETKTIVKYVSNICNLAKRN